MEQKRVSFKVAKAIKEAGYPQCGDWWYSENGGLGDDWLPHMQYCASPTYLDVWLWLWREKGIVIDPDEVGNDWFIDSYILLPMETYPDPEEAIIAAIEYIVDNNLLK